jgi:hypothetical protein
MEGLDSGGQGPTSGCCAIEEEEDRILVGKPKGDRPVGRPRHRWVDNIKMDLGEVEMGWLWARLIWLMIRTSRSLL